MKLPGYKFSSLAAKPDPSIAVILLYGPDEGMVRLSAAAAIKAKLGAKFDPMSLSELTSAQIKAEPSKLMDEANSLMFGVSNKVIYIRDAEDAITSIIEAYAATPAPNCLVILTADNLTPRSALRQWAEKAENAYAVPFYADEGRDLAEFIRQQLSAARIRFDSAAVAAITARLSPNRAVNMQELQKLILYIGEGNTLSAIDAEACLADSNDSGFDDLTISLFDKKPAALLTALEKMLGEGLPPIVALRSCGKYIERLLKVKTALQSGKDIEAAMNSLKPPVFFKQADAFKRHVARYSEAQLLAMAANLLQAEKLAKLNSPLSEIIIRQEMLKLAA